MSKLDKQTKATISDLVAEMESKTTGEIVPVVLENSDSYPAAHFRFALLLSVLLSVGLYFAPIDFQDPVWFLAAQGLGIVLGLVLAFNSKIKRLMLLKKEINEEVYQRALQAYHEHGVANTKDRDGIMIYISLLERRALIMSDIGISAKVDNSEWQSMLGDALKKIKQGELAQALMDLVRASGDKLAQHFPRIDGGKSDHEISELDDNLRTK